MCMSLPVFTACMTKKHMSSGEQQRTLATEVLGSAQLEGFAAAALKLRELLLAQAGHFLAAFVSHEPHGSALHLSAARLHRS